MPPYLASLPYRLVHTILMDSLTLDDTTSVTGIHSKKLLSSNNSRERSAVVKSVWLPGGTPGACR